MWVFKNQISLEQDIANKWRVRINCFNGQQSQGFYLKFHTKPTANEIIQAVNKFIVNINININMAKPKNGQVKEELKVLVSKLDENTGTNTRGIKEAIGNLVDQLGEM